jgi:hypothetical protein
LPGTGIYYRKFAHRQAAARHEPKQTGPPSHPVLTSAIVPNYPIVHAHAVGYGLGYVVGWLLILSPLALLVWFVLRLALTGFAFGTGSCSKDLN